MRSLVLALLTLLAVIGGETPISLPEIGSLTGLGVNIHFTDPKAGEMAMLAAGGFRWVRMDFAWAGTEREAGKYDFAAYDRLLAALEPYHIRAYFILDYSNQLYDDGLSPHTDAGRAAFAAWAAAAVTHFKGKGIVWEMYNEPNIGFWKPKPNVIDYIALAKATGKALRAADPDVWYIGPATSELDFPFLEACIKAGLLEYWDAVSVHPYRQGGPESVEEEYRRVRLLIAKNAPPVKPIPIISGEWGYSAGWKDHSEESQAKMLAREWLTNLANDIPISIWYDWHDDGVDPKEAEHHFGTVGNEYHAGRDPVYDPKPAYLAAKALTTVLAGYHFNKRLLLPDEDDVQILLFQKGEEITLAVWSTDKKRTTWRFPVGFVQNEAIDHLGQGVLLPSPTAAVVELPIGDAPVYYHLKEPGPLLRVAAVWRRLPLEILHPREEANSTFPVRVTNPLDKTITVRFGGVGYPLKPDTDCDQQLKSSDRCEITVENYGTIVQESHWVVTNPITVTILPLLGRGHDRKLPIQLDNPSGDSFDGELDLSVADSMGLLQPVLPLTLASKQLGKGVFFSASFLQDQVDSYRCGLHLMDKDGNVIVAIPLSEYRPFGDFAHLTAANLGASYEVVADGDSKVASQQAIATTAVLDASPLVGVAAMALDYQFDPGWKFLRVVPKLDALKIIPGKPKALGLWVCGDGGELTLRLRVVDAGGQTFQPNGEKLTWTGWRYLTIPLDGTHAGHWGGANDGVIHHPLRLDTPLLLDGTRRAAKGRLLFSGPTLIY